MMKSLNIDVSNLKYNTMIGTGGIGSGKFFLIKGNHTLGREESRSGVILDRKDYCKLHIISHYVKVLLGKDFNVIPVGKVGGDDVGANLIKEMKEVELDLRFVERDYDKSTLFSFCYLYPDKTGGNLTTDDSASSNVDETTISKVKEEFKKNSGNEIVLAVPEVPLKSREMLLKLGKQNNSFCVASFTSEEMSKVINSGILKNVDLLAINIDEAAFAVNMSTEYDDASNIVESSINAFRKINPEIIVSITNGKNGSWIWDGSVLTQHSSINIDVVNTAGAGDAFLSGLITGIVAGLSLNEAQQLATLTGGASVTSPHTINKEINKDVLRELAESLSLKLTTKINNLLEDK